MNKIQAKRILKLADFLKTVPPEKFDMTRFAGSMESNTWGSYVTRRLLAGKKIGDCGTTACAAGWATTMPVFRKLGLVLRNREGRTEVGLKGKSTGVENSLISIFGKEATRMFILADGATAGSTTPKQASAILRRIVRKHYPELLA
jgi:hypothetical protein